MFVIPEDIKEKILNITRILNKGFTEEDFYSNKENLSVYLLSELLSISFLISLEDADCRLREFNIVKRIKDKEVKISQLLRKDRFTLFYKLVWNKIKSVKDLLSLFN